MAAMSGQHIIVTGASSGIGEALAKRFLEAGAKVAVFARRRERLDTLADRYPQNCLVVAGDLTNSADRQRLVDETVKAWGRIDILVNNAGLGPFGGFLEAGQDLWRDVFELNVFAQVFLTQAVLPVMLGQGSGLIVNIASIGGLIAHSDNVTPYVASKHALVGLSRGLQKDLAGSGVRVKAVCPHLTVTELFSASPGADQAAPEIEKYRSFMDSADDVAAGILEQLDDDGLILFPTGKARKAYEKAREI